MAGRILNPLNITDYYTDEAVGVIEANKPAIFLTYAPGASRTAAG